MNGRLGLNDNKLCAKSFPLYFKNHMMAIRSGKTSTQPHHALTSYPSFPAFRKVPYFLPHYSTLTRTKCSIATLSCIQSYICVYAKALDACLTYFFYKFTQSLPVALTLNHVCTMLMHVGVSIICLGVANNVHTSKKRILSFCLWNNSINYKHIQCLMYIAPCMLYMFD